MIKSTNKNTYNIDEKVPTLVHLANINRAMGDCIDAAWMGLKEKQPELDAILKMIDKNTIEGIKEFVKNIEKKYFSEPTNEKCAILLIVESEYTLLKHNIESFDPFATSTTVNRGFNGYTRDLSNEYLTYRLESLKKSIKLIKDISTESQNKLPLNKPLDIVEEFITEKTNQTRSDEEGVMREFQYDHTESDKLLACKIQFVSQQHKINRDISSFTKAIQNIKSEACDIESKEQFTSQLLKDIEEYKSKCEELLDTYKNKSVTTDQAFLQNTTLCKNLVNKNIESLKEALSDESNYLKPLAYVIHSEYYYDELKSEVMGDNDSVNQVDLI